MQLCMVSDISVASGSFSSVCQVEWWSAFRLREHLRRIPAFFFRVYEVADLDDSKKFEATGSRQQKAWRLPTPVYGPQPWWATLNPPIRRWIMLHYSSWQLVSRMSVFRIGRLVLSRRSDCIHGTLAGYLSLILPIQFIQFSPAL